jgi:hypothetical protein
VVLPFAQLASKKLRRKSTSNKWEFAQAQMSFRKTRKQMSKSGQVSLCLETNIQILDM